MKGERPEGSEESKDPLIDMNKEPVERKRKRSESSAEKEIGKVSGNFPQTTKRVLRSRTMTLTKGEEQAERKMVNVNVEDACEVFESLKKEKRRWRPLKVEMVKRADQVESDVSTVSVQKQKVKGRRGRPPKMEGIYVVSSLTTSENSDKVMTDEEKMEIIETADQESRVTKISLMGKKVKGKRGRPTKEKSICEDYLSSFGKKEKSVMVDGEEQVMNEEMVKIEDEGESESEPLNIFSRDKKMKARRGRPPKVKTSFSEVPVMLKRKNMKGRLGRPPKIKDKSGVSLSCSMKEDDEVMERKKFERAGCEMQRVKSGLRRAPDKGNWNLETMAKNKRVKINGDDGKAKNMCAGKRLKVGNVDDGSIRPEMMTAECVEGNEMGLREQKQLLRDQIVGMLFKAGWKIEYRQRQSKAYQDAVYVDRQGRTYWSVTKAYKKFKEMTDKGNASDIDISAFSPIPDETLSLLFRITTKGKKSSKSKNSAGQAKKKASKVKSGDGRTKSKSYRGKRRNLLARRPGDGSDKDGYELYEGKRSLLSWMIDLGTVSLGGKVKYKRGRTKKMVLNGYVTKEGICCDCCNTTHTIQDFESHAKSDLGQPYQNIYLETGNTLFQCMVDSWRKHVEINSIGFVQIDVDGDDPNDDTCNMCGDGGNLICCDSCPSTFHHGCLHIKIPSGDWHCIYCSCKFCGLAGESTSTSNDSHGLLSDMFMCSLCEEKFHVNCAEENVDEDFDHEDLSFCGNECQKIFKQLQVLLGVRHELEEGFFYTVLHHHEVSNEASIDGDSSKIESNSKLAVAFTVMDECFEPIVDERSGTNMIQNVVYNCGSNIRRLNYGGFYTIILEKGDEFVAAASIRIHGSQLAEMPFIGTRYAHRRQGMCKRLLTAIETVLSSLGVEKLVIPAISDLNETWKNVFGFSPLEESKRQEMKHMSLMVFPKTNMLQKPLVAHGSTKKKLDSAVVECTEDVEEHHNIKDNPTSDFNPSTDVKLQNQGEAAAVESNASPLDAPATESIEVEQNTQKEEIRGNNKLQNHGEAAVESIEYIEVEQADVKLQTRSEAAAVESNVSLVDAPAIESVEIQHDRHTQKAQNNEIEGDGASEVEIHDNGKTNDVDLGDDKEFDTKISSTDLRECSDKESTIKISSGHLGESSDKGSDVNISPGNLGESSENRNCLNTSQDENILLDLNSSSEEPKSCVNGFLSAIGNGKCDEHDISGVEGDGKLERQECCISKKEVVC